MTASSDDQSVRLISQSDVGTSAVLNMSKIGVGELLIFSCSLEIHRLQSRVPFCGFFLAHALLSSRKPDLVCYDDRCMAVTNQGCLLANQDRIMG